MSLLHMQVTCPALFSKGWQPVPGWLESLAPRWDEVMPRWMGQAQATKQVLALAPSLPSCTETGPGSSRMGTGAADPGSGSRQPGRSGGERCTGH